MRIGQLARKGYQLQSVSRGARGAWGFTSSSVVSGRNWAREAGLIYDKSVVMAAIRFALSSMTEVDVYVRRPKAHGFVEVPDHPIVKLLKAPNPWYDSTALMSGWLISEMAGLRGCSYTFKHRSTAGRVVALEYLPHFAVQPYVGLGTGSFIDHYNLSVAGGFRSVAPSEILQQRFGPIDPLCPQVNYGPIASALLEVVTDHQAANFTAALLSNVGVTPHLISPSMKDSDGHEIVFGKEQAGQIQARFEETITGDNRGRPIVIPMPIRVDNLSFSPADMNLESIRNIPEERVCAVLGIPPLALQLGTGLENTNNRASADAASLAAARSFTKPYMIRKGHELTRDLIPELGSPGEEVCFRWEHIEALQEDKSAVALRDQIEVSTYKTVNEKRAEKGLPPIDGGDRLLPGTPERKAGRKAG